MRPYIHTNYTNGKTNKRKRTNMDPIDVLEGFTDEDLKKELEQREAKAAANNIPKRQHQIVWCPLVQVIEDGIQGIVENGFPGKDFDHYVFEQALECVFGKDIWKWWNENCEY